MFPNDTWTIFESKYSKSTGEEGMGYVNSKIFNRISVFVKTLNYKSTSEFTGTKTRASILLQGLFCLFLI